MKLISIVLCCYLCTVLAADPARPNISDVFRSPVSIAVHEQVSYKGTGIYLYNVPKGLGRITYRIDGIDQEVIIHEIFRYDLHFDFFIDQNDRCSRTAVTGNLESPWAWVAKAVFAGTTHDGDRNLDQWKYSDAANSTMTISVLSSNVNIPASLHSAVAQGGLVRETFIEFINFDTTEPDESAFNVPKICNITTTNAFKNIHFI